MKKMIVALALAAFASTAMAAVGGSTHDMSIRGGTKSSCQYCHAPHLWVSDASMAGIAPLWNRTTPATASMTAYTRVGGSTGTVTGIARACVSCHDGTTGLGSGMLNNADTALTATVTAGTAIGLTLANDHPVGVTYPTGAGTEYNQTRPAAFVLVAGTVDCSTCHDVHNQAGGFANFLVAANNSAFCGSCHIK